MASEHLDEFRWNLGRLLRIKFLKGLALKDLEAKYSQYFQQPLQPDTIVSGSNNWNEVFKSCELRKDFQVKGSGGRGIIVLKNIEDEQEIRHLLRLTTYDKYVDAMNIAASSPDSKVHGREMTENISDLSVRCNTVVDVLAESDDPLLEAAALKLAKYLFEAISGRTVTEIAEKLHLIQQESSLTPPCPPYPYPDIVTSSPKEVLSPPNPSLSNGAIGDDTGQKESPSEVQPTEIRKEFELGDDLTDVDSPIDLENIEGLKSLIDERIWGTSDFNLDEDSMELNLSLFDVEDKDAVTNELGRTNYPVEEANVPLSTSAPVEAEKLNSSSNVEDVTKRFSATETLLNRKSRSARRIVDTPIAIQEAGEILKFTGPFLIPCKKKRRRRNIIWHHCTMEGCSRKFTRLADWWKHVKTHSWDELMN